MRIRDWGSDVCSSDLHLVFGPRHIAEQLRRLCPAWTVAEDDPIVDGIDIAVPVELAIASFGAVRDDQAAGARHRHHNLARSQPVGNLREDRTTVVSGHREYARVTDGGARVIKK